MEQAEHGEEDQAAQSGGPDVAQGGRHRPFERGQIGGAARQYPPDHPATQRAAACIEGEVAEGEESPDADQEDVGHQERPECPDRERDEDQVEQQAAEPEHGPIEQAAADDAA